MRIGGAKHDNMANELFDFALLGRVLQWMVKW
jgi:fatty acid/phospholipid biosynthesis enzyme